MEFENIKQKINNALDDLYENELYLFNNDLGERCICHKFANYLEKQNFGEDYFIDCEYNRAYSSANGGIKTKKVTTKNGNSIDMVITKRNDNSDDDLACFETKKWNNTTDFDLDRRKLNILTNNSQPTDMKSGEILRDGNGNFYCFNYKYGFFIIFGQARGEVKIESYKRS